jgi:IS5 family transposase
VNDSSASGGQAKHFSQEIAAGVKRSADVVQQLMLESLRDKLDAMVPLSASLLPPARRSAQSCTNKMVR